MKKQKNRLDEMQEQKLLQIEHNGCWLAFWGLMVVLFVQIFLYGRDFERIMGEWTVFMCLAVYIVVSCLKNGIWDRRQAPVPGVNLKSSLLAGGISGIIFGVIKYREYQVILGAAASGAVIALLVFASCFAGLSVLSYFYRERTNRLENAEEEGKEDGEEQN
ncbi:MAG: hypothetical protein K2N80_15000 [Lachnospiraceae bacterium]|nr:hypothetical protein [Lachnospiraceae bacterium]